MLTAAERTRRAVALTLAETARPTPIDPLGNGSLRGPDEPLLVRDNCQAELPAERSPPSDLPAALRDGMPLDRWMASDTGLRRWRPIFDAIEVVDLPRGARDLVVIGRPIRLDAELSAHLAWLLMPEEWRVLLGSRGVSP